jgi:hypothetical protein
MPDFKKRFAIAAACWFAALLAPACFARDALDRTTLENCFATPYSVGERDRDLPLWPIFRATATGDRLIAYIFDYADFAPVPESYGENGAWLVAIGPSGEFLELKQVKLSHIAFPAWLRRGVAFDFIKQDQATNLNSAGEKPSEATSGSLQNALKSSRDLVLGRLAHSSPLRQDQETGK